MKISKQDVQLVDWMGDDLSVVNAARVSFDKESSWEYEKDSHIHLSEKSLSDKDQKLIKYLAEHNHWSPFSHTAISLRIKAPIFVARQLAKHQVGGAWNEVSRRYVDSEPEVWMPQYWRERAENKKQGSGKEIYLDPADDYTIFQYLDTGIKLYNGLIAGGMCPEQARAVLPQAVFTEWIWTGSVYFFSRVCNLRLDPHAQLEVQEVAKLISDTIRPLYPESWKVLVDDKQKT